MARWKKAASVEGDGPRAWLLERRRRQLEKIRPLLSATPVFEFSAYLAGHRERQIESLEQTICKLKAGDLVEVSRWELPRSVELPPVAARYVINDNDEITAVNQRSGASEEDNS